MLATLIVPLVAEMTLQIILNWPVARILVQELVVLLNLQNMSVCKKEIRKDLLVVQCVQPSLHLDRSNGLQGLSVRSLQSFAHHTIR